MPILDSGLLFGWVTTFLEFLEMLVNLTKVRKKSGKWAKVRVKSGKFKGICVVREIRL